MRNNPLIGLAIVLSFLLSPVPLNAEVRQGTEVTIAQDEVVDDDLYIFAQKITVNGTINGDLIVMGQEFSINGSVDGDLIAAAQQIVINGKVTDDARIAGQVITLQDAADIADDLIAAGYSLECTKASRVGGELKFAGYQSRLAGHVEKKVELASANCELAGSFGDSIEAVVDGNAYSGVRFWAYKLPTIPDGLTVTDSADIAGDLTFQSTSEANINPASTIAGNVKQTRIASFEEEPPTLADRAISFTKQFFALLLVGVLVVFIFPKWTEQVVNTIQKRPLASLGWGLLSLVAVIVTAVLLLVATIAIAVLLGFGSLDNLIAPELILGLMSTAFLIAGFWIFAAWIPKVLVSVWAGNRMINGPEWTSKQRLLALALGALVLCVLLWIPGVGSAVGVVVMLMGVGSAALWFFSKPEPLPTEKPVA